MDYKRILTIQDISCVGQCSLTVALPILSACGLETAILPSAILSTHTAGFKNFTCHDLTDEMPKIFQHWKNEGIKFASVYTGYLGESKQIDLVKEIIQDLMSANGVSIIDPAMADNGNLYPAFDHNYVEAMRELAFSADIILPNITEACFLTDYKYQDSYTPDYIDGLLESLTRGGAKTIVLTGVSYDDDTTGVVVYENGDKKYYRHKKISKGCHGTGDVYASAFVGALLNGASVYDAAKIAADFTLQCIVYTQGDNEHWYGVKFEPILGDLIKTVRVKD